MNRRDRRATKTRPRKGDAAGERRGLNHKVERPGASYSTNAEIDHRCDIQVDAKTERIVMILANAAGRKIVEELFPDVEWTTDEVVSQRHSPDWRFTHIRVTKLPLHLEEKVPLAFASPDSIGMAVAMALQRLAKPKRVVHYVGGADDMRLNIYDGMNLGDKSLARELFAEYVPPETPTSRPWAHVGL